MAPLLGAAISAIPSIINLFTADKKSEAAVDLAKVVAKEASAAFGLPENSTEDDVLKHIAQNPEAVVKLKEIEYRYKYDIEALGLESRKEKYRHEEQLIALDHKNTADARGMNTSIQTSENSSRLAKEGPYYIDFAIVGGAIMMTGMLFFVDIPEGNNDLLYMAIGALLTKAGTVLNYHRGSSAGSKEKTGLMAKVGK